MGRWDCGVWDWTRGGAIRASLPRGGRGILVVALRSVVPQAEARSGARTLGAGGPVEPIDRRS